MYTNVPPKNESLGKVYKTRILGAYIDKYIVNI